MRCRGRRHTRMQRQCVGASGSRQGSAAEQHCSLHRQLHAYIGLLIRSVRRFLLTADVNRRVGSAVPEGWPDRTSFVEVSEDDFREFIKIIRPQISDLIEMSNRWLCQRSRLPRNRVKKKRVAGMQVFVFRE